MLWLSVTVDTPSHVEWLDDLDNIHGCHATVTVDAVDTSINVWLVAKARMVGQIVDFHPFDRLALFPGIANLLHFWGAHFHQTVTVHTYVDAGHRGMWTLSDADVTVAAGDLVFTSVKLVAKFDGLLRCIPHTWVDAGVESNQHHK